MYGLFVEQHREVFTEPQQGSLQALGSLLRLFFDPSLPTFEKNFHGLIPKN